MEKCLAKINKIQKIQQNNVSSAAVLPPTPKQRTAVSWSHFPQLVRPEEWQSDKLIRYKPITKRTVIREKGEQKKEFGVPVLSAERSWTSAEADVPGQLPSGKKRSNRKETDTVCVGRRRCPGSAHPSATGREAATYQPFNS